MSIIEKLGIKPIQGFNVYTDDVDDGGGRCCYESDVRELEQNYREAIEALIKDARFVEKSTSQGRAYKDRNSLGKDRLFMVPIIERLTNLPWQKIKDLFDA